MPTFSEKELELISPDAASLNEGFQSWFDFRFSQLPSLRTDRRPLLLVDFDGVICNTDLIKASWFREHLGVEIAPERCNRTECSSIPEIGESNYEMAAAYAYERIGALSATPIASAVESIERLHRRFVLVLASARPADRLAYAREWLEANKLSMYFR